MVYLCFSLHLYWLASLFMWQIFVGSIICSHQAVHCLVTWKLDTFLHPGPCGQGRPPVARGGRPVTTGTSCDGKIDRFFRWYEINQCSTVERIMWQYSSDRDSMPPTPGHSSARHMSTNTTKEFAVNPLLDQRPYTRNLKRESDEHFCAFLTAIIQHEAQAQTDSIPPHRIPSLRLWKNETPTKVEDRRYTQKVEFVKNLQPILRCMGVLDWQHQNDTLWNQKLSW